MTGRPQLVRWNGAKAKARYSAVLSGSPFARLYAEAAYLDIASPNWTYLHLKDDGEEWVMPWVYGALPFSTRQPLFCQQWGIFGAGGNGGAPTESVKQAFYETARRRTWKLELYLEPNSLLNEGEGMTTRKNLLLPTTALAPSELPNAYSQHTHRQLRKAVANKVAAIEINPVEAARRLPAMWGAFAPKLAALQRYHKLIAMLDGQARVVAYGASSRPADMVSGEYEALALWVEDMPQRNRRVLLGFGTSERGKASAAGFAALHHSIQTLAAREPGLTLDFEGSQIEGVARLYEGFGATPEWYGVLTK